MLNDKVNNKSLTITKRKDTLGSSQVTWDVDLNNMPLGAIWTFKPEHGFIFPYTYKPLRGAIDAINFRTMAEAERHVRFITR